MSSHRCPQCNFTISVKIGTTSAGRQRYKCKKCSKTWTTKSRPQRQGNNIWNDFVFHNYSMAELAEKYHSSTKSIKRILESHPVVPIKPKGAADVICMDVIYFGRKWGVLSVLNAHTGECLYCAPTNGYETIADYEKAIRFLHEHGVYPKAAVIDIKTGVMKMLHSYGILVQFCQFHQLKIINQCLTKNPKLEQNQELREIALSLTHCDKATFSAAINTWEKKNKQWLLERTYTETGRSYTHKPTRRAIRSLKNNLPYLFTFEDYPELNIPNTNNKLEGLHSDLKRRMGNHHGTKKSFKIKMIFSFLSGRTGA